MTDDRALPILDTEARESVLLKLRSFARAHPYITVFFFALVARALTATLLAAYLPENFVLDDETYNFMARDMASGAAEAWDPFTRSLYWRTAAFLGPITVIYKVFGPVKLAGSIFVAFLGAGAATLLVRLLKEVLSQRWAMAGGLVIAFFPSQVFWSAVLMKDAAVWMALMGAAVCVAIAGRSRDGKLVVCGIGVVAALSVLAFLREHTLVVASWAVMLGSLAGMRVQRWQRIAGAVVIGVTVPWFVASIGPAGIVLITDHGSLAERRFFNAVDAETAVVDTSRPPPESRVLPADVKERATGLKATAALAESDAATLEDAAARARSAARAERLAARAERLRARARALLLAAENLIALNTSSDGSLDPNLAHLPRGLWVMLIEPLPVPFTGSMSHRLARLESLLWYPLLILAVIGTMKARDHLRVFLMPLASGVGILVMYALAEGNVGTAHRHRGEFVWVVVALATMGVSHLAMREQRRVELPHNRVAASVTHP